MRRRIQAPMPISDSDSDSSSGEDDPVEENAGDEIGEEEEVLDSDDEAEEFASLEKFFADNDNLVNPATGPIEPHVIEAYEHFQRNKEENYQRFIKVDDAGDNDLIGYSEFISNNLKLIAQCLRIRRRHASINFIASRFNFPPPPLIEEINCENVLNREGGRIKELGGEDYIQIRDSGDLDAALFLIKGNENLEMLPKFLMANESIFYKLKKFGKGKFRCMVKEDGNWIDVEDDGDVGVEAIDHLNLGRSTSPRDVENCSESKMDNIDPSCEVVRFYRFYERWRLADVLKSEVCINKLKAFCSKSGVFVHPCGVEMQLQGCVDSLRTCYGEKRGQPFRVWVDEVSPLKVGSDAWLVQFKKYEESGEQRRCCLTTALLSLNVQSMMQTGCSRRARSCIPLTI